MIKIYEPDLFIAGPAFNAGRYGVGCGAIAKAVQDELGYASSYITRVCKGKSPAAYGFKWVYEEDYLKEIKN